MADPEHRAQGADTLRSVYTGDVDTARELRVRLARHVGYPRAAGPIRANEEAIAEVTK